MLISIAFYYVLQFYMSGATCGIPNAYPFEPHEVTPVRVANRKIFIFSHLFSLSMVHVCAGTLLSFSIVLQFDLSRLVVFMLSRIALSPLERCFIMWCTQCYSYIVHS